MSKKIKLQFSSRDELQIFNKVWQVNTDPNRTLRLGELEWTEKAKDTIAHLITQQVSRKFMKKAIDANVSKKIFFSIEEYEAQALKLYLDDAIDVIEQSDTSDVHYHNLLSQTCQYLDQK